jgi:MurNAc alpha-1-phosphate uridylyltransferase
MVPNPDWHPDGDFGMTMYSLTNEGSPKWTFGNIGVYRMEMFDRIAAGDYAKLGPLIREYADKKQVGGEVYEGVWHNVGTVQQLDLLNAPLATLAPASKGVQ